MKHASLRVSVSRVLKSVCLTNSAEVQMKHAAVSDRAVLRQVPSLLALLALLVQKYMY